MSALLLALSAPSFAFGAGVPAFPWAVPTLGVDPGPVAIHIQGTNRYLTAVEASKKFTSASTVVVASGQAFPDALGGAALAGAVDGPLLLTPKGTVPNEVLAEIARLGATKVYVLGSSNAVSDAAFKQLDDAVTTVVRLGGANRYATAQLVADEAISVLGGSYSGDVFLATGRNFPDALAAAPIMYAKGIPLVLVDGNGAYTLPADATKATILGGSGSVPDAVETALGSKFVDRIAGGNRYETASMVAQYGVDAGMTWDRLGLATGQTFPDALCAGPLVGSKNAVLLLTPTAGLAAETGDMLDAQKSDIDSYYLFGGTTALSENVCGEIADVLAPTVLWEGHSLPDVSCTAEGCHDTELATIHIAKGCYMCHSASVEPSNDCVACHGDAVHDPVAVHEGIVSSPAEPEQSCTQADCHGDAGVMSFHTDGCAQCHASTREGVREAIAAGGASCESCHEYATVHVGGNDDHAVVSGDDCYGSSCHGTDVAKMHTTDFRGTGDMPPGCVVCHGEGKTPSKTCTACHTGLAGKHDSAGGHSSVQSTMSGTKSASCTACHGTNLMNVASGQHVGCSCHAYGEARGASECVDCHDDQYAPHGFADGFAHGSGWIPASGHNTTTFGARGGFIDFSSLGVTDTAGEAPTAQFPQSVNNTFKPGYTWNSTVTCEDCHTGLNPYEIVGPHGGNAIANFGIDPAYPGKFESASLWGGTYAQKLADGTTYTVGPFAEGIAQWAPAGTSEEEKQELVNYQVVTPDMSTAASTKLVKGPATVTAGNVICVKCHDLYDSTQATGFKGWGNYAHEHHSADTGSFKMWFGKYAVTVDGSNAGTYTVAAESMTLAKASVVASYGGSVVASSQVIAASLGREDAGACRNCHIAIPHGWKRPKLIVYSNMPNPAANPTFRADKGLPAVGDSEPYNIGPAVYEGEALDGTGIGSGQMNGLASGKVIFREASHLLGGQVATSGSDPAQLDIEDYEYPALFENATNGSEYINWSSAQCNACGHHSSTSFVNPNAVQPPMTWNSRESNWTSTKPANGAWK